MSIDKLNDFIQRLNQGMKVETLKPDIQSAKAFLALRADSTSITNSSSLLSL